jgi:hypothetical protein
MLVLSEDLWTSTNAKVKEVGMQCEKKVVSVVHTIDRVEGAVSADKN